MRTQDLHPEVTGLQGRALPEWAADPSMTSTFWISHFHVFSLWEQTRVPKENPFNKHANLRPEPGKLFFYEATMVTTATTFWTDITFCPKNVSILKYSDLFLIFWRISCGPWLTVITHLDHRVSVESTLHISRFDCVDVASVAQRNNIIVLFFAPLWHNHS